MAQKENTTIRINKAVIRGIKIQAVKNQRSANWYFETLINAGIKAVEIGKEFPEEFINMLKEELGVK